MIELKPCPECGIPGYIANEHTWLNNGDIVQSREEWHRMLFIECENFDPLFHGIEEIAGTSIEHFVITAQRRATRAYLNKFIPEAVRELISKKRIKHRPLAEATNDIAKMMGFGNYEFVDMRYELDEDDFYTVKIEDPLSLPMAAAALAADIEALTGRDQGIRYEEVSPHVYLMTSFPQDHPEEMKEKLWLQYYYPEGGGLELDKVEAQRRFTRSGFYSTLDIFKQEDFRNRVALVNEH